MSVSLVDVQDRDGSSIAVGNLICSKRCGEAASGVHPHLMRRTHDEIEVSPKLRNEAQAQW